MSDFLKKFSNENYHDKDKVQIDEMDDKEAKEEEAREGNSTHSSVKQKSDTSTEFTTSNTKEEIYIIDDERIQKRKKRIIIALASTLVLLVLAIFIFIKVNEVRVPDFVKEKTLNDVQIWAAKNDIEIDYTSIFSVKVEEGYVVKQSKESGATIQKGSDITIVVSKGADPEGKIAVPDFMKMSLTEIEAWKKDNKANNVTIEKVFSEDVEKAKTIRVTFKSDGIDAKNYRRKDKLTVVVSKGKETFEKNIEVPNFKDKSKQEVEAWAKEKEVEIQIEEVSHNTIIEGNVISQDVSPKTKIAKKEVIKIVVSRGKIVYAPNFFGSDMTSAQALASQAEVNINPLNYYSNTVASGSLISQSHPAGSEIKSEIITLVYSLGKPFVANFDGSDVYSMIQSIEEMNTKGARLTYSLQEVSSSEKKGTIISSNYKACFVNVGAHIVISVSKG